MSFREFKVVFKEILRQTPLPFGDIWVFQPLHDAGLRNNDSWIEVLYRTRAT